MLAEDRFKQLLEAAPDAMVIVDPAGTMILINSQTERLFGYARNEMLGQAVEFLIPERFREQHTAFRGAYFAEPRVRPMGTGSELYGLRKDGSEFPVEINLSPMQADAGSWAISSIRDITERRRVEQALHEKILELERASKVKDDLLATMSHELRGPLNAIIGFAGTLLMGLPGPLNTDQTEQLQAIENSATHLLSLINDLLDKTSLV